MLPSSQFTKQDGNTGVVKPSQTGVLAIIAAAGSGAQNTPSTFTRKADAYATFNLGPLVEEGSYYMDEAELPVLLIRPTTSTAAAYGAVNFTGTGTSVITADGTVKPFDDYDVIFKVIAGGTIGVAGITYQYSLDNGNTWSATLALGTASNVTLNAPVVNVSSGCKFDFAAGTLVAGDQFTCSTTRAQMTNADLVTALEALRVSGAPWDAVLIDGDTTAQNIATVDTWLTSLEGVGVFKNAFLCTRHKQIPLPATETEGAFLAAMTTFVAGTTPSIRLDVSSDAANSVSIVTGLLQRRPAAMFVATRTTSIPVGTDPAWVALGPIGNCFLKDANGNPLWHDEQLYPGLDGLRLTTLRTFPGQTGAFITNANIFSGPSSDYVYDQHARVMNAAATAAYASLQTNLSRGVRKQKPDPTTGKIYIFEADAASIETSATAAAAKAVANQVMAVAVTLSRTDDLSSNAGATVNAELDVEALAYIKQLPTTGKFVKAITVPVGG